jgi:hypothetical protein
MLTDDQIRGKWREVCANSHRPPEGIDSGAWVIEVVRWAMLEGARLQETDFQAWLEGLSHGKMCLAGGGIMFTDCEHYQKMVTGITKGP